MWRFISSKSPKTAVCPRISPRTGQFGTVSELKPSHTLHDSLRKLRQSMDIRMNVVRSRYQARQRLMKTKTWTVIANSGKQAELESGLEKKEVPRPMHITSSEFIHWLAAKSRIDDDNLRSLFKR